MIDDATMRARYAEATMFTTADDWNIYAVYEGVPRCQKWRIERYGDAGLDILQLDVTVKHYDTYTDEEIFPVTFDDIDAAYAALERYRGR